MLKFEKYHEVYKFKRGFKRGLKIHKNIPNYRKIRLYGNDPIYGNAPIHEEGPIHEKLWLYGTAPKYERVVFYTHSPNRR